jgi:DNA-binding transcriptional LysR family regulator
MTTKKLPLSDLHWDDMRLFLQIHRCGSLAQAARQLRVDHSTVSRRLGQLELCLGGALYERHRTGLKPTELAEQLLPHAEAMQQAMWEMQEQMGGSGDGAPLGKVRLAMMEGIGSMFVARHLAPLLEQYPGLQLEMVTSASMVHVNRREADIFLSFFEPEGQGLASCSVGQFSLFLYAAPAYLQRYGVPQHRDALVQHRYVGYVDDLVQLSTVRWLEELVPQPSVCFRSSSMLAQMTAAASGMGMVVLPRFAVVKEDQLQPILVQEVQLQRPLWMSVHHDLQFSARIRVVMTYLQRLFAAQQAWLNRPD